MARSHPYGLFEIPMYLLLLPETTTHRSLVETATSSDVYYFSASESSQAEGAPSEPEQDDWFIGAMDLFAAAVHRFGGAA